VESTPHPTPLPRHHIYVRVLTPVELATAMGVYFFGDQQAPPRRVLRCVYCEHLFEDSGALNDHYLSYHAAAFSEKELKFAHLKADA
jgi:hypothetical protein